MRRLEGATHLIVDGSATWFRVLTRHAHLLWTSSQQREEQIRRFDAAVLRDIQQDIGLLKRIEYIAKVTIVFDGSLVGLAKKEEYCRRRQKRDGAHRKCKRIVGQLRRQHPASRQHENNMKKLKRMAARCVEFSAPLIEKIQEEDRPNSLTSSSSCCPR
jgi:5'-3' exonuclease